MLDFATLTGACVNALTERYSGVFTNRPRWRETLAARRPHSGERVWCFPMDEDFDCDLESTVADVAAVHDSRARAITSSRRAS